MNASDLLVETARKRLPGQSSPFQVPPEVSSVMLGRTDSVLEASKSSNLPDTATYERIKSVSPQTNEVLGMISGIRIKRNNELSNPRIECYYAGRSYSVNEIQNSVGQYIRNRLAWYHPEALAISAELGGLIKHELVGVVNYFGGYLGMSNQMINTHVKPSDDVEWKATTEDFLGKLEHGRKILGKFIEVIGKAELGNEQLSSAELLDTFLPQHYQDKDKKSRVTMIGEVHNLSAKEFFIVRTLLKNALSLLGSDVTIKIDILKDGEKVFRITDNSSVEWGNEIQESVAEAFQIGQRFPNCPLVTEKRGLTKMVPFLLGQMAEKSEPAPNSGYKYLPLFTYLTPETKEKSIEIRFPARKSTSVTP